MATVPTSNLRTVGLPGAPSTYQKVSSSPEDFGALEGKALASLGAVLNKVGDSWLDSGLKQEEDAAKVRFDGFQQEWKTELQEITDQWDPAKPGYAEAVTQRLADKGNAFLDTVPETARSNLKLRMNTYANREAFTIGQVQRGFAIDTAKRGLQARVNNLANAVRSNPTEESYRAVVQDIAVELSTSPIPAAERRDIFEAHTQLLSQATAQGMIDKGQDNEARTFMLNLATQPVAGLPVAASPMGEKNVDRISAINKSPIGPIIDAEAEKAGFDADTLKAFIHIESSGNPNAKAGKYTGLGQLSEEEFRRHAPAGADIKDPNANIRATIGVLKERSAELQGVLRREPTVTELYLAHQQGVGGVTALIQNPDAPAWQAIASTSEGRAKGEEWAKKAIWNNLSKEDKARYPGGVESVKSEDFMQTWAGKVQGMDTKQAAINGVSKIYGGYVEPTTFRKGMANVATRNQFWGNPDAPDFKDNYLTKITTPTGKEITVHREAAAAFEGFLGDLTAAGYEIKSIGGYANRGKAGGGGKSQHAWGNAIDINPGKNPFLNNKDAEVKTDLPADVSEMAARWGISWGGDWKNSKDAMHFEYTGVRTEAMGERGRTVRVAQMTQGASDAGAAKDAPAPVVPGNIDLKSRPVVKNEDGTISTVRSISIGVDGQQVLIPTVSDAGRVMTDKEAIEQYKATGKHLGIFKTEADATKYSISLHKGQEQFYGQGRVVGQRPTPGVNLKANSAMLSWVETAIKGAHENRKKAEAEVEQKVMKDLVEAQHTNKLTREQVLAAKPYLTVDHFSNLMKATNSGDDAATDSVDAVVDLESRLDKLNPDEFQSAAQPYLRSGQLKTSTYLALSARNRTASADDNPQSPFKLGREMIDTSLNPEGILKDAAGQMGRVGQAQAKAEFDLWAEQNPRAPRAEAMTQAQDIIRRYQVINYERTSLAVGLSRFFKPGTTRQGVTIADIDEAEDKFFAASDTMSSAQRDFESRLLQNWRGIVTLSQGIKPAAPSAQGKPK